MKKILNTFQQIDVFGVPINLLTKDNNSKFQSKIGGLITMIIGCLSLLCIIYYSILWIGHNIPSTITFKSQRIEYAEFSWSDTLIQLSLKDLQTQIDPFRKENNIITPLLFKLVNSQILDAPIPLYSDNQNQFTIKVNNGTLILNDNETNEENHKEMVQYILVLIKCSNQFNSQDSYCADDNTIASYLSDFHEFYTLTIKLRQLNSVSRSLETFQKSHYLVFDFDKPQYAQILLQQQESIIDDGILFNNYVKYEFFNNYELINQQVDKYFPSRMINSFSNQNYDFQSPGSYLFRIDNIAIVENVTEPKFSQVLAQIGSIVQLLCMLQYFAYFYNKHLLENELLHEIIIMYYPDFKAFKPNLLGKFRIKKNEVNEGKTVRIQHKYQILSSIAKEKCQLRNILYEISRIQFILQQQFGDQILLQSHQLGGKIENQLLDFPIGKISNRIINSPESVVLEAEPMKLLQYQ